MTEAQKHTSVADTLNTDDDEGEPGSSSVGVSSLKQAISALEHSRLNNQHLYKEFPDAQIGLRTDPRIKAFETAAAHKEPERVKMAHSLKAKGSSADTYTFEELIKCSVSCLTDSKGPNGIFIDVRDRAMLLTSTSVAFRGDSSRALLWSDQFLFEVPILAKGLDAKIPALTLIADNAKHNQTGRIEEYGAFRHRHVELCSVGAIATLYFVWFHVLNCPVPDFKPDFTDSNYGEFGRRDWYEFHVFSHSKQAEKPMTYDNHRDRVNAIYMKNNISVSKVTHGGRGYTVKTSREHGASVEGAKALGGWSESGSFRPCYDRALPVDAMLGAAMFDAQKPESHFLPRDSLLPPAELMSELFPWVEQEQLALQAREMVNRFAKDLALMHFLRLMVYFRTVIIQDFAILFTKYPQCPVFRYPPFNSPCFREYAAQSTARISAVEAQAKLALQNLPQAVAETFRGAITQLSLERLRERDTNRAYMEGMDHKIGLMSGLLQQNVSSRKSRPRGELVAPPPPTTCVPPPAFDRGVLYPASTSPSSTSHSSFSSANSASSSINTVPLHSPSDFCPLPKPSIPTPTKPLPTSLAPFAAQKITVGGIEISATQLAAWHKLAVRFGEARLRAHQWEWVMASGKDQNSYLPYYSFQPVATITAIWIEWSQGLNGFLAVRDLEETWCARWRRDHQPLKTDWGRRKKVVHLVQKLAEKPNWNFELALRFVKEKYEPSYTPRKFCEYLQKTPVGGAMCGTDAVLVASNSFV